MSGKANQLKIVLIRTDGGTQPRESISENTVADYAASIDSAEFPAVDVFYDGSDYWLAHGFHRLLAHNRAGRSTISANVHQGTKEDAQWFSYAANQDQDAVGLRRTNADKERAVRAALAHAKAEKMSDRAIAEYVGVHLNTIANYRKHLTQNVQDAPKRKRSVTRKGKTYEMKVGKIGKASAPVAVAEPDDDDEAGPADEQNPDQFVNDAPLKALEEAEKKEAAEISPERLAIRKLDFLGKLLNTPAPSLPSLREAYREVRAAVVRAFAS